MTRTLIAFTTLTALACAPADRTLPAAKPEPALDQAAFRATTDGMREAFTGAAESGDWESAASILDPEAIMVVPGGEAWAAIKAASEVPYPPGTRLSISPIEVRQLSPDWGYEFGTNVVTWTPDGEIEPVVLSDTYLVLFRRGEDGWHLYREVASSNSPPSADRP